MRTLVERCCGLEEQVGLDETHDAKELRKHEVLLLLSAGCKLWIGILEDEDENLFGGDGVADTREKLGENHGESETRALSWTGETTEQSSKGIHEIGDGAVAESFLDRLGFFFVYCHGISIIFLIAGF